MKDEYTLKLEKALEIAQNALKRLASKNTELAVADTGEMFVDVVYVPDKTAVNALKEIESILGEK